MLLYCILEEANGNIQGDQGWVRSNTADCSFSLLSKYYCLQNEFKLSVLKSQGGKNTEDMFVLVFAKILIYAFQISS